MQSMTHELLSWSSGQRALANTFQYIYVATLLYGLAFHDA